MHEPLTRADIERKFTGNAVHGGWDAARAQALLEGIGSFFARPVNLAAWRG